MSRPKPLTLDDARHQLGMVLWDMQMARSWFSKGTRGIWLLPCSVTDESHSSAPHLAPVAYSCCLVPRLRVFPPGGSPSPPTR